MTLEEACKALGDLVRDEPWYTGLGIGNGRLVLYLKYRLKRCVFRGEVREAVRGKSWRGFPLDVVYTGEFRIGG